MPSNPKRINMKAVLVAILLLSFGLLSLVLYLTLGTLQNQVESQFENSSKEKTILVSRIIQNLLLISDFHEIQTLIQSLKNDDQIVGVEIRNAYGETIGEFHDASKKANQIYSTSLQVYADNTDSKPLGDLKIDYSYSNLLMPFRGGFFKIAMAVLGLFGIMIISMILFLRVIVRFAEELKTQFFRLLSRETASIEALSRFDELARISESFNSVVDQVNDLRKRDRETSRLAATAELATQVAHDIRSPIAALDTILLSLGSVSEERRILARSAISRIKDIANHLLSKNQQTNDSGTSKNRTAVLSSLVDVLVSEKRLQFRRLLNVEIGFQPDSRSYGLFSNVDPIEFKRVLSNLINNAVESLPNKSGTVRLDLKSDAHSVVIEIVDTGVGIPSHILPQLGQQGLSFGKEGTESGSGLGLYHARTTIESWRGTLEIESTQGKGTTMRIRLPKASPPKWFVNHLDLCDCKRIVIVDDDTSTHQIWQGRFEPFQSQERLPELLHFSSPPEVKLWAETQTDLQHTIFLMDYEFLGHKQSGLDAIEDLNISSRAILVSSRYEEPEILDCVEEMGIHMIPKSMVGIVPIKNTSNV